MANINKIQVNDTIYNVEDASALKEVPSEYKTKAENDELYQAKGSYLTEEADPVFTASPANGITSQDITNWNGKQDTLTAGDNITIDSNNVISASSSEESIYITGTNDLENWQRAYDSWTSGNRVPVHIRDVSYHLTMVDLRQTYTWFAYFNTFSIGQDSSNPQSTTTNVIYELTVENNIVTRVKQDTLLSKGVALLANSSSDLTGNKAGFALSTRNAMSYIPTAGSYNPATAKYAEDQAEAVRVQYSTMPTAGTDNLGKIVQYTGADTQDYTQGHFYIVVSDGADPATYSWQEISFGGGDKNTYLKLIDYSPNSDTIKEALQEAIDGGYHNVCISKTNTHGTFKYVNFDPGDLQTFKGKSGSWTCRLTDAAPHIISDGSLFIAGIETYDCTLTMNSGIITNVQLTIRRLSGNDYRVLHGGNTTAYTPTSDYNPSTKKYTDDTALATVVADKLTGTTAPTTSTVGYVGQQYTDTTNNNQYVCTAVDTVTPEYTWLKINSDTKEWVWEHPTSTTSLTSDELAILQTVYNKYVNNEQIELKLHAENFYIGSDFEHYAIYYTSNIYNNKFYCYFFVPSFVDNSKLQNTKVYAEATITDGVLSNASIRVGNKFSAALIPGYSYEMSGPMALVTNNTIQYTPTGDYHPATKKYVDDAPTTYTGYDATKTQTLKNINGVLTWVDD